MKNPIIKFSLFWLTAFSLILGAVNLPVKSSPLMQLGCGPSSNTAVVAAETTAAQFTAANTEYFTIADNASLSLSTDTDYSITAWVYSDAYTAGANDTIFVKGDDSVSNNNAEYKLNLQDVGGDQKQFRAFIGNGSSNTTVTASTFGNLSTMTWYFVTVIHDKTNDLLKISVNNGSFNTAAWSGGTQDTATGMRVGVDAATGQIFDGMVDQFNIYKDENLSADEITSLYNSGAGLAYCQASGSLLTNLQAWWNFSETSGTREDSTANNNDLTDNNTVTSGTGVTTGNCL